MRICLTINNSQAENEKIRIQSNILCIDYLCCYFFQYVNREAQ